MSIAFTGGAFASNSKTAQRPTRGARCRVASLAFLLTVWFVGAAHADEQLPKPAEPAARAHFDEGNKAFLSAQSRTDPTVQRTEYERAIKAYLAGAAVEVKYLYTFYWNLGHAYRQLGEYTRADHFYKKFLEFAPQGYPLHRAAAEDFRRMMKAELDKAATLAEPIAPAPASLREPTPLEQPLAKDRPDGAGSPWHADRVGWVLVGGGVTAALVGGGFLLSGSSLYDQAADEDRQAVANDLEARGDTRVLIGGITGAAGIALLASGVIKLAVTEDRGQRASAIQVSVGPSSFAISGSF
jgi:tetratricopeptide (TPR) repeat protein